LSEPRRTIDLVGPRKVWYALSLAVILPGLFFGFHRWSTSGEFLNRGIDFTGGALTQFQFERPFGSSADERVKIIEDARKLAQEQGVRARVEVEGDNFLTVDTPLSEEENLSFSGRLKTALDDGSLGQKYGISTVVKQESVGPVIGAELKKKAIYALIVGIALIIMYLSYRYDFKFAVCAIIALIHDVLVMVGAMAMTGMVVNSEFVAALLTMVGFSVHDTVVIFDRIRENSRLRKMEAFDRVVNGSLLQTMARSVNTVLTVLFMVVLLFLTGGASIHSFAFALLVGITSGAYSSIFNASQILVSWKGREVSVRQRVASSRMAEKKRLRGAPSPPAVEEEQPASTGAGYPYLPLPPAADGAGASFRNGHLQKKLGGKRRKRY
jgi:preprotein translocase subunit SecF